MRTLTFFLVLGLTVPRVWGYSAGTQRDFDLGFDARILGLGSASVALPDDASAALGNNPALLSTASRGRLLLFHAPLFDGTRYDSLAFVWPTLDQGSFGIAYRELRTPNVEVRDSADYLVNTFQFEERALTLAFARPLPLRGLQLGVLGQWFQQSMDQLKGESFTVDVGLAYQPVGRSWTLGLSTTELYDSGLKLSQDREIPPPGARFGGSWVHSIPGGVLTALLEGTWVRGESLRPSMGAEYEWRHRASLRAGWDGYQFSTGAGLSLSSWTLQYALTLQRPLGLTHRVSLALRFGPNVAEARRNRKSHEDQLKSEILEKLKTDSIRSYMAAGDQALENKDYAEARDQYSKVLAWDPRHTGAQDKLSRLDGLEKAYKTQSNLAEAKKLVADGNDLDAMVIYKTVLDLDPANEEARKGMDSSGARMRQAGRKAFSAVSNLSPAEAQKTFEKGLDLYLSGKYSQAMAQWKILVAANPLERQVFDYVSRAQTRLETDKAQSEISKKKAVQANRVELLRHQAFEDYRKGDLKSALDAWKEILSADPQNAEAKSESEKIQAELQDSRKRGVRW